MKTEHSEIVPHEDLVDQAKSFHQTEAAILLQASPKLEELEELEPKRSTKVGTLVFQSTHTGVNHDRGGTTCPGTFGRQFDLWSSMLKMEIASTGFA